MILKLLMIIIFLVLIPEMIGLLILHFWGKEKNNLMLGYVLGYVIQFAVAQILSVPMIFLNAKYTTLFLIYTFIIIILGLISFIIRVKQNDKESIKNYFSSIKNDVKNFPRLLAIICILLIGIQIYMYVGAYTHVDDDDAYYVGTATTTIQTNTIFRFSPTTGSLQGEQNALRYRLRSVSIILCICFKLDSYSSSNSSTYDFANTIYDCGLYNLLFTWLRIV